ncbi:MAG: hypothetical protein LBG21_06645 [Campylobacteraceae bacterium]|jgi:endonuclease YncB( thermonuclease family)|nr:hypothetical protein [Campylobacteraceae bacterium]
MIKIFFALFIPIFLFADITGKVLKATDGDTITILTDKKGQIKVRFDSIDAPESKQAYKEASRKNFTAFCIGESATIEYKGQDRHELKYGEQYVKLKKKAKKSLWQDNNQPPHGSGEKRKND